jgi:hypothetical protein
MSRQLTPQNGLDGLKKEAKRWLKALRAHDPEARARLDRTYPNAPAAPGLRDVQHALALEHGLAGWTALKALHSASPASAQPTLQQYEEMAEALIEAYRTGTPAALERHWKLTWHRRSWNAMRTYVRLDLGKRQGDANGDIDISLADAQFLVAREHGFESWQALAEYVAALSANEGTIAAKTVTVFYFDDAGARQAAGSARDWDTVIAMMQENRIPGLNAEGQMTDNVLERISRLDHVTSLNLRGSKQLTDEGARYLARMPRLQHLDLSGTAITDRGLVILRQLTELKTIGLSSTSVTDAGIANLANCKHLEQVDVSATQTGDVTIKALAGKRKLGHFRSGANVTDAGLPLFQEFPVFKTWQGGEARMALLDFDAGPNHLGLRGTFTNAGLASLVGLDGLFALNLDDSKLAVSAPGMAPLVSLPNLGWLAFDATDEAMPYIAAMPKLRFLMCQDTQAGDNGFVALSRSQSIQYIWGRRCYNLRSRGFTALAAMPALRSLSVSCKNVDDSALSALPRFPALRELMPMDVPDDGYRHIGHCDHLEALILMYCRETTDAATEHIADLRILKKYFASYTRITDRTPELLSSIASLEQVEFSACAGLTNNGIAALARLPRLRELRLGGMPKVTPDIVTAFPASVRVQIGDG